MNTRRPTGCEMTRDRIAGDAWSMHGWNADCPDTTGHYVLTVVESLPLRCEMCQRKNFWFNGRTYWCETCNGPLLSGVDIVSEWDENVGYDSPETFRIARPDPFYEESTALYRQSAASNWPHGRIRPRVNRWANRREF